MDMVAGGARMLGWLQRTRTWYMVAVTLVVAALALTLLLQAVTEDRPSLFLFFAAIVSAAWLGGTGAGLVAAVISVPAGIYFYATSNARAAVSVDGFVMLVFFALCAAVGAVMNARRRTATARLIGAHRELEAKAGALEAVNAQLRTEIAERRRAEQALKDAQAELLRVSRLTTIGQLSASIAHEVNQPLTGVIANAGSCVRWLDAVPPDLAEARAAARRVVRDGERASAVISNIRGMVRRGMAERGDVDIGRAIGEALDMAHARLAGQGVAVTVQLAAAPPVTGDRIQLEQLFLNLILNAAEAFAGQPAEGREIRVTSEVRGADLLIVFADNGPGFDPEVAKRPFEAFVTTKPDGMGFGLPICRTIVETHGGTIEAESGEQGGAVIRIRLPLNGRRAST